MVRYFQVFTGQILTERTGKMRFNWFWRLMGWVKWHEFRHEGMIIAAVIIMIPAFVMDAVMMVPKVFVYVYWVSSLLTMITVDQLAESWPAMGACAMRVAKRDPTKERFVMTQCQIAQQNGNWETLSRWLGFYFKAKREEKSSIKMVKRLEGLRRRINSGNTPWFVWANWIEYAQAAKRLSRIEIARYSSLNNMRAIEGF